MPFVLALPLALVIGAAGLGGCAGIASSCNGGNTASPAPLRIVSTSVAAGFEGTAYSQMLVASGGTAPYMWTTKGGVIPPGLQLNAHTGTISGTPTRTGHFQFTIEAQDSEAAERSIALSLVVSSPPYPTISDIAPNNGPTSGGMMVLISGSNFRPGAAVEFGATAATAVEVASATEIRAVVPAESSGRVGITVKNSDGKSSTDPNAFTFTFTPPPVQIVAEILPEGSGFAIVP